MARSRVSRRRVLHGLGAGTAALAFTVPTAAAKSKSDCRLDWRKHLSAYSLHGRPDVQATVEVVNSKDSGHQGYWAYIDHTRTLRAWELDDDRYRLVAQYTGSFDAVEGRQTPGESSGPTLSGDESGSFQGGYAATIEGTMRDDPEWDTRGHVGTVDYEAEIPGPSPPSGYVDWVGQYFDYDSFEYEWWGWIYRGGRYGTWVSASTKECGDIRPPDQ